MISSQGTKVLTLSTFNENTGHYEPEQINNNTFAPIVKKKRDSIDSLLSDGPKKSETQLLVDFLREGPPPPAAAPVSPQKKGFFKWSPKKPKKKEELQQQQPMKQSSNYGYVAPKTDHGYVPPKKVQESQDTIYEEPEVPKPRQQKGVSFAPQLEEYQYADNMHRKSTNSISDYYDSYAEEQVQNPAMDDHNKPVFGSRGSSLKNLETMGHKLSEDLPKEQYVPMVLPPHSKPEQRMESRMEPPQPRMEQARMEPRYDSRPEMREPMMEQRHDVQEVKVLNHRFEPVVVQEPVVEKRYEPREVQVRIAHHSSREQLREKKHVDANQYEDLHVPQLHYGVSRHPSQKAEIVTEIVSPKIDSTTQTEVDQVQDLQDELEQLKRELAQSREENLKLKDAMAEQKRGFDKLSAQAYKKIKELLTDRNIMQIEIKSLQSQMDQMELQYQSWAMVDDIEQ
jgi:hypothetical protein